MADSDIIYTAPGGRVTEMIWDESARKCHFVTSNPDIEPLLDDNVRLQNDSDGWLSRSHEMRLVARISVGQYRLLRKSGLWDDFKARARWLNSSDHSKFRTNRCAV